MKKCSRETMIKLLKEVRDASAKEDPSQKEKIVIKTLTRKDIENEYFKHKRTEDID